ncbi:MAG: oligosaccharide flippase family protein [Desulfobacteraceae bacterium]|nr:oligosaccharide flippase family protein [Desulfobacteraceae bacterium]MBC2718993.1 oligosaccharide flippase family protein [Desulfobacteraceae bacterium]
MSKSPSPFVSNVLKLTSGSIVAQGLGILAAPILTRLFAPEAFGVAALFASITGIIGVVACLRYELSIMLPKTDEEAANLLGVSAFFVLVVTGISVLVILFAGDRIARLLNSPDLSKYLWLVPPTVFVSGVFLALNYWNSRTKHFGRLSIARVVSSVATQITKLSAGFAGFVSGGVLIGTGILGQIVSTFVLGGQIWRDDRHLFKASIRWEKMITGLKRHKKFPIYNTWSAFLNTASQQLPTIMLAFYFSPKVVGFYALGKTVLSMPMNMVGGAVAQVFFQKASEVHNSTGNLSAVVEEVFNRLVSLGIFPILLLMLIGEDLFVIAFGARWAEAGVYMQILGLWIFFQFISSPISTLFAVLEKQHYGLLFNTVLFLTRAASLIIGGLIGDVKFTLFLFASTGVACYGFLCFWLISKAGLPVMRALYCIVKYSIYSSPLLMVIALAKWSLGVQAIGVLLLGLCCLVVYYLIVMRQDKELKKPIHSLFQRFGFIK